MSKARAAKLLVDAHEKLGQVLKSLNGDQMTQVKVLGEWTVKDILAHLAAWNWECLEEIERALQDKATWHKLFEEEATEDEFNRIEVAKRRPKTVEEIRKEWEKSFQALITRVKNLSEAEWAHRSDQDHWQDGKPLTLGSLFDYGYTGESHEAGHAKQIQTYFRITKNKKDPHQCRKQRNQRGS